LKYAVFVIALRTTEASQKMSAMHRTTIHLSRLVMAGLMVAALSLAIEAQDAAEAPPSPPPGRLVDVGGWRLHLNCTGRATPSQPTVILEAGIGDFSVEWGLVQPGVASLTRVCSYDRAGDGWSDVGPHPRTMRQIVYELSTLLERAGERPPYVLVGHSYGGWLVRLYQSTYPSHVVGMVLVEAGSDDPVRMLGDGRLVHASDLATGRVVPAVKTSNPLRESEIPPTALDQMKAGAAEAAAHANPGSRSKLPPDAQRMRTWALARWQHVAAAVNPFESEELAGLRAKRAKSDQPLGDMPLVVLARGISDETGPDAKTREDDHQKEQAALAMLSRNRKRLVATQSGHHIQLDEPNLVIKSIGEVLKDVRK
jgi:pimeloyl-ACP methyl ester carboxylesterase